VSFSSLVSKSANTKKVKAAVRVCMREHGMRLSLSPSSQFPSSPNVGFCRSSSVVQVGVGKKWSIASLGDATGVRGDPGPQICALL